MQIFFVIPGEPQGKARPRFARSTGRIYTAPRTWLYEDLVRQCFRHKYKNGERFGDADELKAVIVAYFKIPISTPKKKREEMLLGIKHPVRTPDTDNIAKIILDSLNGLAYKDDSKVVQLIVQKRFSDEPRVEVLMWNDKNTGDDYGWLD